MHHNPGLKAGAMTFNNSAFKRGDRQFPSHSALARFPRFTYILDETA